MKKCIISLAFILALGGYASAQKPVKKTTKNGTVQKAKVTETKPQVIKDSSIHHAKIKLDLPPADTSDVVIPKKKDN